MVTVIILVLNKVFKSSFEITSLQLKICRKSYCEVLIPSHFNCFVQGWLYILKAHGGKLPLRIRAVPEGSVVPVKNGEMKNNMLKPMLQYLLSLPTHFFFLLIIIINYCFVILYFLVFSSLVYGSKHRSTVSLANKLG